MNINCLPSPLLQRILSALPLASILRLHHVCSKWAFIQRSILQSVTRVSILLGNSERHKIEKKFYNFKIPHLDELEPLPLTIDHPIIQHNSDTELHFEWLDLFFAELITRQLPNITSLLISVDTLPSPIKMVGERSWNNKVYFTDSLILLLNSWSAQLTRLTFIASAFYYLPPLYYDVMNRLFSGINQCQALRHLSLEVSSGYELTNHFKPPPLCDFPVFGWLETLNFEFGELHREAVKGVLKHGADNANLRSICFYDYKSKHFEHVAAEQPHLVERAKDSQLFSKFHQFGFVKIEPQKKPSDGWRRFVSTFTGLQRLSVTIEGGLDQLEEVLGYIGRQMESLLFLNLDLQYFKPEMSCPFSLPLDSLLNSSKKHFLPTVSSVRILQLSTADFGTGELHAVPWEVFFPNLEVVDFTYDRLCQVCYPREKYANEKEEAKILPNISWTQRDSQPRRLLLPWVDCPKLRVVHSNSVYRYLWTEDEDDVDADDN